MAYHQWLDIVFLVFFGIQILFNLIIFVKQIRQGGCGSGVIILTIFLLTGCLAFRFLLTLYQAKNEGSIFEEDSNGNFYKYLYFEFPYHLFNIVAFIVLMQWIQLWAVLSQFNQDNNCNDLESEKQSNHISKRLSLLRYRILDGAPYYFILFGVTLTLLCFLVADTAFVSVNEAMDESDKTMTILFQFMNFQLSESEIDNDHLIFIYIEEIIFNFVIFYNLALKQEEKENFEPQYEKANQYVNLRKSMAKGLMKIMDEKSRMNEHHLFEKQNSNKFKDQRQYFTNSQFMFSQVDQEASQHQFMMDSQQTNSRSRKPTEIQQQQQQTQFQEQRSHLDTESEENESPSKRQSTESLLKYSSPLYSPTSLRRNDNFRSMAAFKGAEGQSQQQKYFLDEYKSQGNSAVSGVGGADEGNNFNQVYTNKSQNSASQQSAGRPSNQKHESQAKENYNEFQINLNEYVPDLFQNQQRINMIPFQDEEDQKLRNFTSSKNKSKKKYNPSQTVMEQSDEYTRDQIDD
eukprot:403344367